MESKYSRKEEEKQTCKHLIENAQEKEKQKEKDVSKCDKKKAENQYMLNYQNKCENEEKENKNEGSNKKEYANKMVVEQQMENCVTSVGEGEYIEKCSSKNSREQGQNKTIENNPYEHSKEMHKRKDVQAIMESVQTKSTKEEENEQNKSDSASGFSQNEKNEEKKYMIENSLDAIAQQEQEKQILGGIYSKCVQRVEESKIDQPLSECPKEGDENPRLRVSLSNVFQEEGIYTTFEKELDLKCSIEMKEDETKTMRGNVRNAKEKRIRRKLAKQALKNKTVNIPREKSITKKPATELPKDKMIDTKLWYSSRKLKLQLRYKYGTFSDCIFSQLPLTRQSKGKDHKEDKYYCSFGLLSSLKHDHKNVYAVFNVQADSTREFRNRLPFHPKGGGVWDYVFYDIPGFENIPEDLPIIAEVNVYTPPPPPPDHLDNDSMNPGNQQQQINLNTSESIVLPLFANSETESDDAEMHTQSSQHSNLSMPPPDFLE